MASKRVKKRKVSAFNIRIGLKRAFTIISGLTLSHLLAILLTASIVSASFVSYNLYLDAIPHTATYTIETDGAGNYRAIRYDGKVLWPSTNASYVFQSCLDSMPNGGSIFWKQGIYYMNYDVTYHENITLIFEGEGSRVSRYHISETESATIIYFNQSNFIDEQNAIWNDGYTYLVAKHIAFVFYGGSDVSGKGYWKGRVTLTDFEDVYLLVDGNYTDSTVILFDRATGPPGRTACWRNVVLDAQLNDGLYCTVCRVDFDTFLWHGGSILTNLGSATWGTRLFRLEASMGAEVSQVSSYRDDTEVVIWFWLTPIDWGMPYLFEGFACYGWSNGSDVQYHFSSTQGMASINLVNCNFSATVTKLSDVGYSRNWGIVEASNDDWVSHTLAGTPTLVTLTIEETDANYCLQLKATNSTHFQIYLYDLTASTLETVDKTINWYAEYKP